MEVTLENNPVGDLISVIQLRWDMEFFPIIFIVDFYWGSMDKMDQQIPVTLVSWLSSMFQGGIPE